MISHFRRRVGVLAAVAVLAALVPTLATSTASAAPATTAVTATTVDAPALFSACPASASIPSAGFTDTTDTAVDCIKYYGITSGTTATTYSPTDSVTRWQMALYMTRLLDVANVTLGSGADQGFTDISGKSAEIQTAVNQIKQAGITVGKTATTYAPDDNVSRQEMAMFIERMLDNLAAGPGGVSENELVSGLATTYINSNCGSAAACTGKYNYTDIDSGSVTVEASNAIKELFTLNIHDGVSATTFSPDADMTRAAMATFLTAALAHTNVRPEGLHLQASTYAAATATVTPTLSVSYRDASFDPIASAPVDVHYWTNSTTEGNNAFFATGLCDNSVATTDSITACKIDATESGTDESGNMTPTANATDQVLTIYPGADTYTAWTAASTTVYDNDLHGDAAAPNKHSSITVTANPAAASVRCSVDTPAYAKTATAAHTVKFGTTHTVTCQTVSATSGATAGATATPLQLMKMIRTQVFTDDNTAAEAQGPQHGDTLISTSTQAYTGADGSVTFTIDGPTDTLGADIVTDSITITAVTPLTVEYAANTSANYSGHMADDGTDLQFSLVYKDTTAAITNGTVTVTQSDNAGAPATTGVTRSVTATTRDQYGSVLPAQVVTFTDAQTQTFSGATCSAATPTVCTTLAAHGLSVGEDIVITATGTSLTGCSAGAVTIAATSTAVIKTVPLTTTFTLDSPSGTELGCSVASDAAGPTSYTTTSFNNAADNTRTTNSSGQATFSWVDTEPNGGADTVTATTGGVSGTKTYYKTTTAASFTEVGDLNGTLADNEDSAKILSYDAAANSMLVEVTHAGGSANAAAALTQKGVYYHEYTWDSNDQFAINATDGVNGTASTMAEWEADVALNLTLGASAVDFINTIVWAPLTEDVTRWHTK